MDQQHPAEWKGPPFLQAHYRLFSEKFGPETVVHVICGDPDARFPVVPMERITYYTFAPRPALKFFPTLEPGEFAVALVDHKTSTIEFFAMPIAEPDAELPQLPITLNDMPYNEVTLPECN